MTITDTLAKAYSILASNTIGRGVFYRKKRDGDVVKHCFCMAGAVLAADLGPEKWDELFAPTYRTMTPEARVALAELAKTIEGLEAGSLGTTVGIIGRFNDNPERKRSEILAVFRTTIDRTRKETAE